MCCPNCLSMMAQVRSAPSTSTSKRRRLRAAATKRKLFEAVDKESSVSAISSQLAMLTCAVDNLVAFLMFPCNGAHSSTWFQVDASVYVPRHESQFQPEHCVPSPELLAHSQDSLVTTACANQSSNNAPDLNVCTSSVTQIPHEWDYEATADSSNEDEMRMRTRLQALMLTMRLMTLKMMMTSTSNKSSRLYTFLCSSGGRLLDSPILTHKA